MTTTTLTTIVGVIGGSAIDARFARIAEEVGERIAARGALLVCGGRGGVMAAACRGAKRAGGTTIGILPGATRAGANRYVDIPIATGMGEARNVVIVHSADVCIAVDGRYGTLSEIAFALTIGTPVVAIASWELAKAGPVDERLFSTAADAEEAVACAFERVRTMRNVDEQERKREETSRDGDRSTRGCENAHAKDLL